MNDSKLSLDAPVEGDLFTTDQKVPGATQILREYLLEHCPDYQKLFALKRLGWKSKSGDEFFEKRRVTADQAGEFGKRMFFSMMRQIGDELHLKTSALTPECVDLKGIQVLDICMAPGGFSTLALEMDPNASICGITLPVSQNGHELLLPGWETDPRIEVCFADLTMLSTEMGIDSIPLDHPDVNIFSTLRPFSEKKFDLVFCDGQVLRSQKRSEYRETREALRLLTSELVVALQRIKQNGSMVILLHRLDGWDTVLLIYKLSQFSSIQLFKPEKKHAVKSSFYLVAKNIQSQGERIKTAIESWKRAWQIATFASDAEYAEESRREDFRAPDILSKFGETLVSLSNTLWKIQFKALQKLDFIKNAMENEEQVLLQT